MRKLLLSSILALVLIAPTALADSSTVVRLKSGAEYHGQIVEKVPGDHLTLQLVTGEVKRFAWSEIAADVPETPQPPPAFQQPAPQLAPAAQDTRQMTFVHIDVKNPDDHVELRRVALSVENVWGAQIGSLAVGTCMAPCDQWVPAGEYYVGGRGLETSRRFDLNPGENSRLLVDGGSHAGWIGGIVLTGTGLGLALSGLLTYALGTVATPTCDYNTGACTNSANSGLEAAGLGMTLVGGVLTAVGIYVWLHNRTTVDKQGGANQATIDPRLVDALSGTIRF